MNHYPISGRLRIPDQFGWHDCIVWQANYDASMYQVSYGTNESYRRFWVDANRMQITHLKP